MVSDFTVGYWRNLTEVDVPISASSANKINPSILFGSLSRNVYILYFVHTAETLLWYVTCVSYRVCIHTSLYYIILLYPRSAEESLFSCESCKIKSFIASEDYLSFWASAKYALISFSLYSYVDKRNEMNSEIMEPFSVFLKVRIIHNFYTDKVWKFGLK